MPPAIQDVSRQFLRYFVVNDGPRAKIGDSSEFTSGFPRFLNPSDIALHQPFTNHYLFSGDSRRSHRYGHREMSFSGSSKTKDGSLRQATHVHYPFWFGGSASCFAAAVTHPLDLIKVRLQTRTPDGPKGMLGTFVHILKNDHVLGLYRGLSASLLRQLTYSTTRFGIYSELKETFTTARSSPSFLSLITMASTSGFFGGIAGNPADVLNVRMQHDASLPPVKRRNYRNAIDGLIRMTREEGWRALWRGVGANSMRAVLMTASQLASYDGFKRLLLDKTTLDDTLTTHFTASFLAGFVATTICSPVDVIKTRVMSAHTKEGLLVLLRRTIANEGIGWMFKGWVPSFVRLGPHTIVTFLFLEQHKTVYRRLKGLDKPEADYS